MSKPNDPYRNRTTTEPRTEVGRAVRRLRIRQKLSLTDLANLTGFSLGHLSGVESGTKQHPTADTIRRLTVALRDHDLDIEYAALKSRYETLLVEIHQVKAKMEKFK
jgi:transcriptional regulator with XRE-family HTH domain